MAATDQTKFFFRQRSGRIDWMKLGAVDVDKLSTSVDVATLNDNVDHIAFAQVTNEDVRQFHSGNFIKLFRMCQFIIEYLLHVQDALAAEVKERTEHRHDLLRELQAAQERIQNKDAQLHAAKRELKYNRKVLKAYEKQAANLNTPSLAKHGQARPQSAADFGGVAGAGPNLFPQFGADGLGHGVSGAAFVGGVDDQTKQSFAHFVVKAMGKQLDDWGYEFQQQIERRVVNAVRNNQVSSGNTGDDFMQADRFNRLEAELQGYQRQVLSMMAQQEAMSHRRTATGPLQDLSHHRAQQMEQQRIEDQLQEILRRQTIEGQEVQALLRHSTGRIVSKIDAVADEVARRRLTDTDDDKYRGTRESREFNFEPGRRMKELGLTPSALLAGKAGLKTGSTGLFSANSRSKRMFGSGSRSQPTSPRRRPGVLRTSTPQHPSARIPVHPSQRNAIPSGRSIPHDDMTVGGHGHTDPFAEYGRPERDVHSFFDNDQSRLDMGGPNSQSQVAQLVRKKPVYPVMDPTSVTARFPHQDQMVRETASSVASRADQIQQPRQLDNLMHTIQARRGDAAMMSVEQRAERVVKNEFQPSQAVRQELDRYSTVKAAHTIQDLSVPLAQQHQELQRNVQQREQDQQRQMWEQQQRQDEQRRLQDEQRRRDEEEHKRRQDQQFGNQPQQNQPFGQGNQSQTHSQQPSQGPNNWGSAPSQANDRFSREQEEKRNRRLEDARSQEQQFQGLQRDWDQQRGQSQPQNSNVSQNQPFGQQRNQQQQPQQSQPQQQPFSHQRQQQEQPQAPPRQSRQLGSDRGGVGGQQGQGQGHNSSPFGGATSSGTENLPPLNSGPGSNRQSNLAPLDTGAQQSGRRSPSRVQVDAPGGAASNSGAWPSSSTHTQRDSDVTPFGGNNQSSGQSSPFRAPAGSQPTPFTTAASQGPGSGQGQGQGSFSSSRGFSGPKALGSGQSAGTTFRDGVPVRNNKVLLDDIEPEQEEFTI